MSGLSDFAELWRVEWCVDTVECSLCGEVSAMSRGIIACAASSLGGEGVGFRGSDVL
jgi:hypothetical protein